MNRRTSKAAVALLAVTVLGLAATGCSGATKPTASTATGAAQPAATTATQAAGGGTTSGTAPTRGATAAATPAAADRCHTGEVKADIQLQGDRPGSAMLMLVNKSTRTCTVFGYPGVGGLLADNSKVALTANRVAHPGAPVAVTLKPGTTAFAGLDWAPCSKSDVDCKVLAGLELTPPDETTQVIAAVLGTDGKPVNALTVSKAGVRVGSLQPASQGVVFTG
ncbi:DUF4232 domain-containing protein [Kitasatospora sp. MBT63]|uniref:DUF4232 domain-containing protein n=1 Tax=Kitasatospora sp. MBT63 TaxID=1444768 RepID=UPI00068D6B7E|nr:DUF4232 domain-containing protein [Kitasatospora sp. MBT63]